MLPEGVRNEANVDARRAVGVLATTGPAATEAQARTRKKSRSLTPAF
jgi:hypothetical protein